MKTPTQLGFDLDYQETQSMEYARHPFDALLTYETWLENKALITGGFENARKLAFHLLWLSSNVPIFLCTIFLYFRSFRGGREPGENLLLQRFHCMSLQASWLVYVTLSTEKDVKIHSFSKQPSEDIAKLPTACLLILSDGQGWAVVANNDTDSNYSARIAIKRPSDSSFYPQGGPESGSSDTNEETFASGPERKADTFHGRPALTQRSWPFTWALFRQLLQLCAASRALPAVSACIAPQ
ncbi:hypothetical protein MJG53_009959 [Ovis ammon polii x Ovis aries]|uniref:Uncharacterized protein n=1 Tax=Ovis ammon polii x Ovis aries TaxID=2918886 RepID=A0ACB9UVK3_9CETA|nr:hypothetical protein MJG53_009959 [Ovis ammon polii x Ovis aries]